MTILPIILTRTVQQLHHWLREIAYSDMARQASGWIPDSARVESTPRIRQPINLDFHIPKKHRLGWISRSMDQRPH